MKETKSHVNSSNLVILMPSVSIGQMFFLEFNSERLNKFKEGKKRRCVVFTTFPIQKIRHFQKVVLR